MSEYGLDCHSRRSKSCVVNDGSLSTEVLRVAVGYRGTRSKTFRFMFRSKEWREEAANEASQRSGARTAVSTSHSIFQQRDHSRAELCFKLCISTGYEP